MNMNSTLAAATAHAIVFMFAFLIGTKLIKKDE
jgi:hypothetical protein